MAPKLSIIITSYNIEKYIGECLQNVIDQTIKDIEIIVVDDGSTDKTTAIITEYAEKDSRIIPMLMGENSPGGVATPANIGIDAAKGEYIGFADGDDLYESTMFEKLYLSAKINNADVAMCNYLEFETESGAENKPFEPAWEKITQYLALDIQSIENKKRVLDLLPVPWRKIYKKSLLDDKKLRFPVGDYFFEDNGFHWFTTLNAHRVSFVDEILCYHRRNRAGQTMSSGGERLLGVFHQHSVIYDYLSENNLLVSYRDYSLNWLIGHVSWIQQVLDPKYASQFYQTVSHHIAKYSRKEVQNYFLDKNYDRKTIELIVAVLRNNESLFVSIMSGKFSNSLKEKVLFNYNKLGLKNFLKMSVRHSVFKLNRKKEYTNELKYLLEANERKINELNNKVAELEKTIETGFILIERYLKNKK
ncbi:glycosyltransferase [Enterobacteriaceae bacterium RIT691]|nr:glycosyltransferase [Enterobacteriaceae bacterium RIT691]